jgi:hypothetical protein
MGHEPTRAPAHRPGLRTAHRGATTVAACCELAGSRPALFGAARTPEEHAEDPNATVAPTNDGHTVPASDLADPSEYRSTVDDADGSARGISTGPTRLWI